MILNNHLYQSFVDPAICQQLINAQLLVNTSYKWLIENDKAVLFTLAFDEDNYYEQAYKNIEHVNPIVMIPAYQVIDMEKLLPDHMLTKTNTEYELHCSCLFEFDVERGTRLPDVYAKMVLRGIEKRKIDVGLAIKKLTVKN